MADPEEQTQNSKLPKIICIYYRQFLSGVANIVKPLTKLTKKQAFQWTPEVEATFQTLEEALRTAPILAYQQPGERFIADRRE
jgi:hypothetical protein